MKHNNILLSIILLASVLLTACAGSRSTGNAEVSASGRQAAAITAAPGEMIEQATEEVIMPHDTPEAMMTKSAPAMDRSIPGAMEAPAWFSASLTNVRSDEVFTISDLKGKVVLVETMAMWCPTCLRQQKQVVELHKLLGARDDFVTLGLDIDPNEVAADLKTYTENNGFDWIYAISPAEVSREIGQLYGDQFLNPPSTPMLIIDRHGEAHPLPFGVKDAQSLMTALEPYLAESM